MTSTGVLEKSEGVLAALEALRSRLSDEDRGTIEDVQGFVAEVKRLVSTMDGQLAALRFLAQKQYRPKSDSVPPGQLALDLLGFMLAQGKENEATAESEPELAEPLATKPPARDRRTSKLHLVPVVSVDKPLPEAERVCEHCTW